MGEEGGITGGQMAGGLLEGQAEALKAAGEGMLRQAKPMTRFVLKRIPGGPALVFDAAEMASAPNKTRAAFGVLGGALGGVAGAGLGAAAGGVNAPIGAAVGSSLGENLGEQIYDEHAADIDHSLEATKQWMADRWRQLQGRAP